MTPPMDDRKAPARGAQNSGIGQLGHARNGGRIVSGSLAFVDLKRQEDLLRIVSALHQGSDRRLIKSVGLEQALDAVYRLGDIAVLESCTQRKLRGAVHLGSIGRLHHLSFHRDSAEKMGILGDKAND